jgi:molecular chaperone GrpE
MDEPGYTVKDRRWWVRDESEESSPEESRPTVIGKLEEEISDLKRRLRVAIVEQEQARQRLERDARREVELGRRSMVAELLPVLDDLDRALATRAGSPDPLVRGVELVRSGFLDRMRSLGVERDDPTGAQFDPARHEAVSLVPGDRSGLVAATVAPGYRIGTDVIRPARVVVTRADREDERIYPAAS